MSEENQPDTPPKPPMTPRKRYRPPTPDIKPTKMRPMTEREAAFVRYYLSGSPPGRAYVEAGYTASTKTCAIQNANKLKHRPCVIAAIEEGRRQLLKTYETTVERVVAGLRQEAENAGNPMARVKAWELLGKYLGMFAENHKHHHTGTVQHQVEVLTDEQRAEKLAELLQRVQQRLAAEDEGRVKLLECKEIVVEGQS